MAVVGFVLGGGVGESAGGGGFAVEDVGEGVAAFLAGEAGEENGGYVGVGDPGVNGADSYLVSMISDWMEKRGWRIPAE